jgi:hypothetical protein
MKRILVSSLLVLSFVACSKEEKPAPAPAPSEKAATDKAPAADTKGAPAPTAPTPSEPPAEAIPAQPTPAEPAAPLDPALDKHGQDTMALLTKLGEVVDANKDDCAKAAAAIKKFGEENKDKMAAARDALKNAPVDQQKAFMAKYAAQMGQVMMSKVQPVAVKCKDDKAFAEAFSGMRM